jgi:hypothetical protein
MRAASAFIEDTKERGEEEEGEPIQLNPIKAATAAAAAASAAERREAHKFYYSAQSRNIIKQAHESDTQLS